MPVTGLDLHCDKCDKQYAYPAMLAKHALRCTGAVQTRGRIDRLAGRHAERTPPAGKSKLPSGKKRKSSVRHSRALVPVQSGAPSPLSSLRVTFLGQLHEARERIDTAIVAIEALA